MHLQLVLLFPVAWRLRVTSRRWSLLCLCLRPLHATEDTSTRSSTVSTPEAAGLRAVKDDRRGWKSEVLVNLI